jgi:hypothetical protein
MVGAGRLGTMVETVVLYGIRPMLRTRVMISRRCWSRCCARCAFGCRPSWSSSTSGPTMSGSSLHSGRIRRAGRPSGSPVGQHSALGAGARRLCAGVSTAGWRLPGRCRAGVRPVRRHVAGRAQGRRRGEVKFLVVAPGVPKPDQRPRVAAGAPFGSFGGQEQGFDASLLGCREYLGRGAGGVSGARL